MGLRSKWRKRALIKAQRALLHVQELTERYYNDTRMVKIHDVVKQSISPRKFKKL